MSAADPGAPAPRAGAPAGDRRVVPYRAAALGAVAAAAAMAVAAIARAMDVPLEVDGEPIPVAGFATVTIAAVGIGLALAAGLQHRHRFVVATVALTAVSLVPSIALPDHTATRVVLVLAHLIAAAIVIPLLASQLPERPPAR